MKPWFWLATALLLTGCASPYRWVHPTIPEQKWRADIDACTAYATGKVDEDFGRTEAYDNPAGSPYGGALRTDMRRFDATKTRDRLAAECLRDRGYQRVKAENPR